MKQLALAYVLGIFSASLAFWQKRADSLLVFAGEKIDVKHFKPQLAKGEIPFDEAFNAKYRIIP